MTATISLVGLNHRSAPVDLRERFVLSPDQRATLLDGLSEQVEEVVILSTCNRTEIAFQPAEDRSQESVLGVLADHGGMTVDDLRPHLYVHEGHDALVHLFRVAAALDSLVPGETQIVGQVKDAFDQAFRHGCIHANFNRIYQKMLQTVKVVRTQTGLGQGVVSVSSVAVRLAQSIYENLINKRVLLVGAGEMCSLAADYFRAAQVAGITVANRTAERARELAERVGGETATLDDIPRLLRDHDIVFCSTASDGYLVSTQATRQAIARRRGTPLLFIDMSVPRDVDPGVLSLPEVYLYNIDDLQGIVNERLAERRREAEKAEAIVHQQVLEFERDANESIGPVIRSLHERVGTIKGEQLQKLFNGKQGYTPEQQNEINRSVDLIVNRLLHDPLISLRKGMEDEERTPRSLVSVFRYLFNL